jgi:hypothetical protein
MASPHDARNGHDPMAPRPIEGPVLSNRAESVNSATPRRPERQSPHATAYQELRAGDKGRT